MSILLILLFACSCGVSNEKEQSAESDTKLWKKSYDKYLNEVDNQNLEYVEKDIDGDGTPELILKENVKITVYAYTEEMIKVGDIDFQTGTTRLLYSENSMYPGIFYYYVSGGLDHYGYVSINDMKLVNEELWNEDYSGILEELGEDREKIEELSDDKELIEESKKVYENNNDLVFIQLG